MRYEQIILILKRPAISLSGPVSSHSNQRAVATWPTWCFLSSCHRHQVVIKLFITIVIRLSSSCHQYQCYHHHSIIIIILIVTNECIDFVIVIVIFILIGTPGRMFVLVCWFRPMKGEGGEGVPMLGVVLIIIVLIRRMMTMILRLPWWSSMDNGEYYPDPEDDLTCGVVLPHFH